MTCVQPHNCINQGSHYHNDRRHRRHHDHRGPQHTPSHNYSTSLCDKNQRQLVILQSGCNQDPCNDMNLNAGCNRSSCDNQSLNSSCQNFISPPCVNNQLRYETSVACGGHHYNEQRNHHHHNAPGGCHRGMC